MSKFLEGIIFYPSFGCPKANIESLSRGQPCSPGVEHSFSKEFDLKGHQEPSN